MGQRQNLVASEKGNHKSMNDRIYQVTGIIGSITAWAGVFNLIATGLAIMVSLCSLVIIGPKAWSQVKAWREKNNG